MNLDSIQLSTRIVFGLCSLVLVAIILAMIHGNAIKEKYALLWLPLGFGFLALSLFPDLLLDFSARVHLHYMTVVVLGVIMVFTNIQLYFTVRMSQMREDVKKLSQEIALLRIKADRAAAEMGSRSAGDAGEADAASGWVPAREGIAGVADIQPPHRPASAS